MRTIDRRAVAALAAVLAAVLGACSKDSDKSGCSRANIPATGPGDALNYFPAAVGWTWEYRVQSSGGLATTTITGTAPVSNETAFVFMSYGASSSTTELVVKRPSGAYLLADPSAEPPFDQLYPSLILPFPVEVRPASEQVRCTNLDVGDLDGDGKSERADLSATLQVFSVTETAQVPAGSFSDVAHVQIAAHVTVRATWAGTVSVDALQDDWYARDVGRVVSHLWLGGPGLVPEEDTLSLESWTAPPAPALLGDPAAASPSPSSSAAPERLPLEQAALRLARRAVAARR